MTPAGLTGLPAGVQDFLKGFQQSSPQPTTSEAGSVPALRLPPIVPDGDLSEFPTLSDEQQAVLDAVASGRDVIVDSCVGAGKTTTIQALCQAESGSKRVLYLTYSKLLKADAQRRVRGARVQNYHGVVYPSLKKAGIACGLGESVKVFNDSFRDLSADFPRYDLLVIDEYQDMNEEYARLVENIKSLNPLMQTVMVGDMAQKVRSDTTLNAQEFAKRFCEDPVLLPFTQSFRVGPDLGELLSEAWNKPVVGANTAQTVRQMDFDQVLDLILSHEPGDILCLGARSGSMSTMLNLVEERSPDVFNKNTVYASIRDGDGSASYDDSSAVFTTYDSSKGLERPVAVVFDYTPEYWDMRLGYPDSDPEVLRNIFLVAASRGKDDVVFVRPPKGARAGGERVGFIPVYRFQNLPDVQRPQYSQPFRASTAFDFTYAENIETCMGLIQRERLDDGSAPEIIVSRRDGLIDLSPAVGHYQEALFFSGYDVKTQVLGYQSRVAEQLRLKVGDDDWRNALILTAADTEQMRYSEQVTATIPTDVEQALIDRLGTLLPRDCPVQRLMTLTGTALHSRDESSPIVFQGVADAVHDDTVYELKFVSELDHSMFLQLGLYLAMSGLPRGVLWNVRTDERWEVRVPDPARFLNAVVHCVTKQSYRMFEKTEA